MVSDTPAEGLVGVAGVTAATVVLNGLSASGNAFCLADDTSPAGGIARGEGNASSYADCEDLDDWTPGGGP